VIDSPITERQKSWSRGWRQGLSTERLIIRGLQPGDHAAWRAGYAGRKAPQHPYDGGTKPRDQLTLEKFTHWQTLQQRIARRDDCYAFWLFLRDGATTVGAIDFSTLQRSGTGWCNLGYVVHNQHQKLGLATEALAALLPVAMTHLGYHRIEAAIRPDNLPAIALAKSAGLKREGIPPSFGSTRMVGLIT
jgi:[ribosomal protein S5]-alanine N-acetyltransferase